MLRGTTASLIAKIAKLGLACTVPGSEFQRRTLFGGSKNSSRTLVGGGGVIGGTEGPICIIRYVYGSISNCGAFGVPNFTGCISMPQ